MKIVVISHSSALDHPGGAETAAANHVAVMRSFGHEVTHIACKPNLEGDFGYDEESEVYLIRSSTFGGPFHWTETRMAMIWRSKLQILKPDVVHLHHYLNIGVMLPALIRQILPNCRIILTLHEYLAICGRGGQMVDKFGSLCNGSAIQKCASCLSASAGAVATNRNLIMNSLSFVDFFICPSFFLLKRYEEAGFSPRKLCKVDNFIKHQAISTEATTAGRSIEMTKFVFVSQHTPFKGIEVLLRAIGRLARSHEETLKKTIIEIWGSGSERWPDFNVRISEMFQRVEPWITLRGRYDKLMLPIIYDGADYMVLPSTWWENAPVTIFESLSFGVPVIGSDLGGIREALLKEPSSILFKPNCDFSLSEALLKAVNGPNRGRRIFWNVSRANERSYEILMKLYAEA